MSIPHAVLTLIIERSGGRCEICGRNSTNTHHRRRRGMGGSKDPSVHSPANLIRCCGSGVHGCHGAIERNRAESYSSGRLLRHGQNPTEVPVLLRQGWVYLTETGDYVPAIGDAA